MCTMPRTGYTCYINMENGCMVLQPENSIILSQILLLGVKDLVGKKVTISVQKKEVKRQE